jgi:hypothetical protein
VRLLENFGRVIFALPFNTPLLPKG